ncbi:alpha-L-arabinofuranosidase C-terminal domain-containing protein [Rathayibacter sp. KR2-224]|uniref:alpha-L-arabinofuranosidase C-terminal domain-containing protein n=1 Tax=Rathayibacter sp. KR2-224 TaxID=3400913 RepID=UPI003C0FCE79
MTTIVIDDSTSGTPISADLWGAFIEDLNHTADGGLYAELIQNRCFRYAANPLPYAEGEFWDALSHWRLDSPEDSTLTQRSSGASAVFATSAADARLLNDGFDGIPFTAGAGYRYRLIARAVDGRRHRVRISLLAGASVQVECEAGTFDASWRSLEGELMAPATADGSLGIALAEPGAIELRFVSLFPIDTFRGRRNGLRKDLAEAIEVLRPRFLRFPGGCLAHGYGLRNMYRWKSTIGPVEDREEQFNIWGYHQSMGLGYLEYFEFCEDIGAKPLPVVAAGVCCQNSPGGQHAVPEAEMDAYIQDVLDLIEWANGGADSRWGSVRARDGHPEPFGLEYLGIGNEDAQTALFRNRFDRIAKAVRAAHPDIRIVGTSGPSPFGKDFDDGWAFARSQGIELVDEHMYPSPRWFFENVHRYDSYPREGRGVYLGEYASQGNTLLNALSEAAFMSGLERNGDIVRLASYAPLLAKTGRTQWVPDLVYFDNRRIMLTLNHHVQRMYAATSGDASLPVDVVDAPSRFARPPRGGVRVSLRTETGSVDVSSLAVTGMPPQSLELLAGEVHEIGNRNDTADYDIAGHFTVREGATGFVVSFGDQAAGEWFDWSIGSWGSLALLSNSDGFRHDVVDRIPFSVAEGDELDVVIRVRDAGNRVTCLLDGEEIFDYVSGHPAENRFVASAVRNSSGKRVFVRLVNALPGEQVILLRRTGQHPLRPVRRTELAGPDPDAGRAFEPAPFEPLETEAPPFGSPFSIPPYSFTVLEFEETQ